MTYSPSVRFWTGEADAGAQDRLAAHVCLMNTLGLRAAPVSAAPCLLALLGPLQPPASMWRTDEACV
jgi:hypothetical protein